MMQNVGEKIKDFREEAGISQKKLGLALGLSDKAVSAYESGRTLPPLETLHRISQELNKPLKFFLAEDGEESVLEERLDTIQRNLELMLVEIKDIKKKLQK